MDEIKLNMNNLSDEERERLMALVEKANKPKSKVWNPEKYQDYCYINWYGVVEVTTNSAALDDRCYEIGNAFRTEEEAKEEAERRKILTKWKRLSIESGEDENEWNGDNCHFAVYYNYSSKSLTIDYWYAQKRTEIYFATKESLLNAISEIGIPNIKKYILGIKE